MSRRLVVVVVIVVLMATAFSARQVFPGKAAVKLPQHECNADLWTHVYQKERLRILEQCAAVEGSVVSVDRRSDGDLHIGLAPKKRSVLNLMNVIHCHRELIVEVICEHPPTREEAKGTCANFHSLVAIPQVGNDIRVTGSYVTDRDYGWNEIHPVTRVEILR